MGIPAFAQEGPTFTDQDAKVIFEQRFESDWETWSTTPVGKIDTLEYYNNSQATNSNSLTPWSDQANWQKGLFRTDSVITLYNGVVVSDAKDETWGDINVPGTGPSIVEDKDPTSKRHQTLDQYGVADKGGNYYFKYISDTVQSMPSTTYSYTDGVAARYRRNLFVRGLDIQENSSYRLTLYVKANLLPNSQLENPTFYADVMRGYYHAEKPFTMGYISNSDSHPYEWSNAFEYSKTEFTGDWEKVTFMTYYLTDSIANYFVFKDGYWWAEDNAWLWSKDKEENTTGKDLRYIVQPDKFFVRLGFASDFTEFAVDNISLTKSWIGGCEYYGDKMRVDFGYQTNLSELVAAAKKKTGIGAVEIPGENFEVWGLKEGGNRNNPEDWEDMPMRSAEYHEDGYMYLFTEFYEFDGEEFAMEFDNYDEVLVTFNNSMNDEALKLKYSGSLFPMATDTTWIKAGKVVPDFYNELATPNPNIFKGVHSMKDLPPVLQKLPYEEGSFFLDPVDKMEFKFSRRVLFDNKGEESLNVIAYVGNDVWTPSYGENDSILVITKPAGAKALSGDVEVKIIQIYGMGTDQGAEVVAHYSFGPSSRDAKAEPVDISFATVGEHKSVAQGVAVYDGANGLYYGEGTAVNTDNFNRMFIHEVEGSVLKRGYEVRPHNGRVGGHLYLGVDDEHKIHLTPGTYSFKFTGVAWAWGGNAAEPVTVYTFPYVSEDLDKVKTADKTEIGVYTPTPVEGNNNDGSLQQATYAIENADFMEYAISIAAEGDYIIEFNNKAGAWAQGSFVGDFALAKSSRSAIYVGSLNTAVEGVAKSIANAKANLDIYGGEDYDALVKMYETYKPEAGWYATAPSEWTETTKKVNDAASAFNARMASIDKFVASNDSTKSLKSIYADKVYAGVDDYVAIVASVEKYAPYDTKVNTKDDIDAATKEIDAAIKKLNDHLNKIADFSATYAETSAQVADNKEVYGNAAEFKTLSAAVEEYAECDTIGTTLDALTKIVDNLKAAAAVWAGKINSAKIFDMQLNAIEEFIVNNGGTIDEQYSNLNPLVDDKAGFYMLLAKKVVYTKFANNSSDLDSIEVADMFLTNSQLYTLITKSQLGSHQMMENNDLDYFPGWKYTFTKGHPYFGNGTSWQDGSASNGTDPYNAFVNLDWNTGFILEQTVENLPAGNYTLGLGYKIQNSANDGHMIVYELQGDSAVVLADSLMNKFTSNSATGAPTTNHYLTFENKGGVKFYINPSCGNNGWGSFDGFELKLNGAAEGFDYQAAVAEIDEQLTNKMTFVAPVKAGNATKYYDLNGVQISAPKAGFSIKVENGVATKQFVK